MSGRSPSWSDTGPFQLARLADCHSPDSNDSPGAEFLIRVRDATEDYCDRLYCNEDDAVHEIADGAVNVYTYPMWREFIDVCAWEEGSPFGDEGEDMTRAAMSRMYAIGLRLVRALLDEDNPAAV